MSIETHRLELAALGDQLAQEAARLQARLDSMATATSLRHIGRLAAAYRQYTAELAQQTGEMDQDIQLDADGALQAKLAHSQMGIANLQRAIGILSTEITENAAEAEPDFQQAREACSELHDSLEKLRWVITEHDTDTIRPVPSALLDEPEAPLAHLETCTYLIREALAEGDAERIIDHQSANV
ncbi:hypothetical protein FNU76_22030 [Chitinimonas arctica]|uniref:Chemotaxis protein n=1 Tax=Chitinimonas arctica TaxID=2594795 RepID=A0A516SKY9_9NEIS|nr:hypothetical protein [Chitinimonas arctica]QDQ28814.1 hypothetical protein FNU76_22030 [Chitinimonas arctica]